MGRKALLVARLVAVAILGTGEQRQAIGVGDAVAPINGALDGDAGCALSAEVVADGLA